MQNTNAQDFPSSIALYVNTCHTRIERSIYNMVSLLTVNQKTDQRNLTKNKINPNLDTIIVVSLKAHGLVLHLCVYYLWPYTV